MRGLLIEVLQVSLGVAFIYYGRNLEKLNIQEEKLKKLSRIQKYFMPFGVFLIILSVFKLILHFL